MKNKRLLTLLGSVCLVLIMVVPPLMAACAKPAPTPTAEEPVRIGVFQPLAGVLAKSGQKAVKAHKAAIAYINEHGGILGGRKVEALIYDTKSDANEAATAARKAIVVDKVKGIVGFCFSFTALAAEEITKEYRIPLVVAMPMEPQIIERGYFGVISVPTQVPQFYMPMVRFAESRGGKTAVLLTSDTTCDVAGMKLVQERWGRSDSPVKLLDTVKFSAMTTDITAETRRAASLEPDILLANFFWGVLLQSGLKATHTAGFPGEKIYLTGQAFTPEEIAAVADSGEGVWIPNQYFVDPAVPANVEFATFYEKEYGEIPGYEEDAAWESTMILLLGMDKAGTDSDLDKIAKGMHTLDWTTPRGDKLRVRENGVVMRDALVITQIRGGKRVIVEYAKILPEDYE